MKKTKAIIARDAAELARAFGLSSFNSSHWTLRSDSVTKIIDIVTKERLTHAEVAKMAKTSRTRVTSILNRNINDVSTDLLLRILENLGYRVRFSIVRQKLAA